MDRVFLMAFWTMLSTSAGAAAQVWSREKECALDIMNYGKLQAERARLRDVHPRA